MKAELDRLRRVEKRLLTPPQQLHDLRTLTGPIPTVSRFPVANQPRRSEQARQRKRPSPAASAEAAEKSVSSAKKKRQEELNQSTASNSSAKSAPVMTHDDFVVTANEHTFLDDALHL